jgi:phenylacetyl-CoA:acceptor oxidoreductase subunit 2
MNDPLTGSIPYGTKPWRQTSWDARAAGNFVFGGAGSGLVVFSVLAGMSGTAGATLLLTGAALVALGLFCVSLELGRPLRAINVLRNPRTSWMSREAIAATLLMPAAVAAVFVDTTFGWVAAALALAFVYCQANIVRAARGIPAWREPLVVALLVATALVEGAGIFLVASLFTRVAPAWLVGAFAVLVAVRASVWTAYRRRLAGRLSEGAARALDHAGVWLQNAGTLIALATLVPIAAGIATERATIVLGAIAGALALLAGGYLKYVLITRAGFNQGLALVHLPVRGVRR